LKVKIDNLEKLKSFQILALRLPAEIEVVLQQDQFSVNARRSLGILSLDLDREINLMLVGCNLEKAEEYLGYFEVFGNEL